MLSVFDRLENNVSKEENAGTMGQNMLSVFERLENNVEKKKNAGSQHFLLFQHCFRNSSSLWLLKLKITL